MILDLLRLIPKTKELAFYINTSGDVDYSSLKAKEFSRENGESDASCPNTYL